MNLEKSIVEINQDSPKGYVKPTYIYLEILDNGIVKFTGKYMKEIEKDNKNKKDEVLNEIRKQEKSLSFTKIIKDKELVKDINSINKNNKFEVDDDLNIINKKHKMHVYNKEETKLVETTTYTIDITENENIKKIKNELIKKDSHLEAEEDIESIKIDSFLNYDWTVNFYTTKPYKYWKNTENLEDYLKMIEKNTDRDVHELKNKDKYVCHHHPNNYGLDKYVDRILENYKSKLKGDRKQFNEIKINISNNEVHLKISTSYVNKIL